MRAEPLDTDLVSEPPARDWSTAAFYGALAFLAGVLLGPSLGTDALVAENARLNAEVTRHRAPERAIYWMAGQELITPWQRVMLLRAEEGLPVWREPKWKTSPAQRRNPGGGDQEGWKSEHTPSPRQGSAPRRDRVPGRRCGDDVPADAMRPALFPERSPK